MSYNLVVQPPENANVFDDWGEVPEVFSTKSGWDYRNRVVKKGEEPTAFIELVIVRSCSTVDASFEDIRYVKLFHRDQTKALKTISKERIARKLFHKYFVTPSSDERHIRWSVGDWSGEGKDRRWDKQADKAGWKTIHQRLTWGRTVEHLREAGIYGVYGDRKAQQFGWCPYAMIDLDLHGQCFELFERRLDVLLHHFHERYGCHYQVQDAGAKGVHFFFFDANQDFLLSKIIKKIKELHHQHPECEFLKPNGKLDIEIFPSFAHGHRLPLVRGRSMLIDQLSPKLKNGKNDVVRYIDWLDDSNKKFMPAIEVKDHLFERLDLACQRKGDAESTSKPKAKSANAESAVRQESGSIKMKGKTKVKLIGYWRDQEPEHFQHFNSALLTLMQAMHAEGLDEDDAVDVAEGYVSVLDNPLLSSRLGSGNSLLIKEVYRTANKVWATSVNKTWRQVNDWWNQSGFRVSDKSTWIIKNKLDDVVVDCEEVEFTEDELALINSRIAPVMFGAKQALKLEKQKVAVEAVAYFLRYVKCCRREIPTYGAIPQILGRFPISWGKREKQSKFFNVLKELDWIYVRAEFYHPNAHGAGVLEIKPRARAYGVGAAIAGKFALSTPPQQQRSITVFPFLEIEETVASIVQPFEPRTPQRTQG